MDIERVRDKVRALRDLELREISITEQLTDIHLQKQTLIQKDLPDLFNEAGVDSITIQAEGNQPSYTADLKPFYTANIAASWPQDKREAAFQWLQDNGHQDLIKTEIVITLGRGEADTAAKVQAALKALDVPFTSSLSVHFQTLSAFVKEQITKYHKTIPLEILGAQVGENVKIKLQKEKPHVTRS